MKSDLPSVYSVKANWSQYIKFCDRKQHFIKSSALITKFAASAPMETFYFSFRSKIGVAKNCCPHRAGAYGGRVLVAAPGRVPNRARQRSTIINIFPIIVNRNAVNDLLLSDCTVY